MFKIGDDNVIRLTISDDDYLLLELFLLIALGILIFGIIFTSIDFICKEIKYLIERVQHKLGRKTMRSDGGDSYRPLDESPEERNQTESTRILIT